MSCTLRSNFMTFFYDQQDSCIYDAGWDHFSFLDMAFHPATKA